MDVTFKVDEKTIAEPIKRAMSAAMFNALQMHIIQRFQHMVTGNHFNTNEGFGAYGGLPVQPQNLYQPQVHGYFPPMGIPQIPPNSATQPNMLFNPVAPFLTTHSKACNDALKAFTENEIINQELNNIIETAITNFFTEIKLPKTDSHSASGSFAPVNNIPVNQEHPNVSNSQPDITKLKPKIKNSISSEKTSTQSESKP